MQCRRQKEYSQKAAKQNGKTGEKCGNICMYDCLRGKQRSENASPPDNSHRAGDRQDITGNKRAIKQSPVGAFLI